MVDIELREGETVLEEIQGDYWEKLFLCLYSQIRGKYWITSERIIFQGGFATTLEIEMKDIEAVTLCAVGGFVQFLPTGIKVTTREGNAYKLSVLSRRKHVEVIENARASLAYSA